MTVNEANIEASEQCFDAAGTSIRNGDLEKAEKFLNKAIKLYPKNTKAEALLTKLKSGAFEKTSTTDSSTAGTEARRRPAAAAAKKSEAPKLGEDYTQDQLDMVTKLKK